MKFPENERIFRSFRGVELFLSVLNFVHWCCGDKDEMTASSTPENGPTIAPFAVSVLVVGIIIGAVIIAIISVMVLKKRGQFYCSSN